MQLRGWCCTAVPVSCADLIRIPYFWSVPGEEIFSGDTWTVRYTNQIRTRYRNWRTTSATQLQPSQSLRYIGHTSTWWQHNCSLTVQTHYAIYIPTPERISQGHVQNGRRAIFSWPTLCYNIIYIIITLTIVLQLPTVFSTVTCCTGL